MADDCVKLGLEEQMEPQQVIVDEKLGPLTVLRDSGAMYEVTEQRRNHTYWIPKSKLRIATPIQPRRTSLNEVLDIKPSKIKPDLIEHLLATGVRVNVQAAPGQEQVLAVMLSSADAEIPAGFQYVSVGANGGTTVLRVPCFYCSFELPADPSIIPCKYSVEGTKALVFRTDFALGIIAAGFPINSYKGQAS